MHELEKQTRSFIDFNSLGSSSPDPALALLACVRTSARREEKEVLSQLCSVCLAVNGGLAMSSVVRA